MVLFEKVVAFLEITPESDQCFLMGVRRCQCFQPFVCEPRRENLNWQMLPIPVMDQDGEPIDLFDAVVRDGNAAYRSAVAMKKNVSPWALVRTKDAVGSIRITNMEAQEEIALRIENPSGTCSSPKRRFGPSVPDEVQIRYSCTST